MPRAGCGAIVEGGERCRAQPMHGSAFCFWHNPETQVEAAEARKLGGRRRHREGALAGAYEVDGLASSADLRRVLEIALYDTLGLENTIPRTRTLVAIVQMGARLLEVAELEERLAMLEATLQPRMPVKGARGR
jgi:hypothetical protein